MANEPKYCLLWGSTVIEVAEKYAKIYKEFMKVGYPFKAKCKAGNINWYQIIERK